MFRHKDHVMSSKRRGDVPKDAALNVTYTRSWTKQQLCLQPSRSYQTLKQCSLLWDTYWPLLSSRLPTTVDPTPPHDTHQENVIVTATRRYSRFKRAYCPLFGWHRQVQLRRACSSTSPTDIFALSVELISLNECLTLVRAPIYIMPFSCMSIKHDCSS